MYIFSRLRMMSCVGVACVVLGMPCMGQGKRFRARASYQRRYAMQRAVVQQGVPSQRVRTSLGWSSLLVFSLRACLFEHNYSSRCLVL